MSQSSPQPFITPHVVRGLDSLRFLAAAVVAGGHGIWLPFQAIVGPIQSGPLRIASGLWGDWLNGGFAVCIFFIISGFCIHYPNAGAVAASRFSRIEFLIKRFVRIGLPLAATFLLLWLVGGVSAMNGLRGVLWSIICELIYYALYPFLLPLLKGRWRRAVIVGSVISLTMLAAYPTTEEPGYFRWAAFVFCSPAWLLGALLAERYRSGALAVWRLPSVWLLRPALPLAALLSNILYYHVPIHVPMTWSIVAFVPLGYIWLSAEVKRLAIHPPNAWLERFGLASYSIYLLHKPVLMLFHAEFAHWPALLFYLAQGLALAFAGWLFYLTVEAPSHRLAKWLGAQWRAKSAFASAAAKPIRAAQENYSRERARQEN